MDAARELRAGAAAWVLVGCVFVGLVLFGATRVPIGGERFEARHVFAGLVLAAAGLTLLLLPRDRRPGAGWIALVLAFPAWLLVQQIPLPAGWVAALDPGKIRMLSEVWPGPLTGCEGQTLLPSGAESWRTLSLDPHATRGLMFRVLAAGLAFLAARAVFGGSSSRRGALLFAVALFTSAEAAYGVFQWISGAAKILWIDKTAYLDSATGTLVNRNHFALLLYLGLGCTLSLLVRDSHQGSGSSAVGDSIAERWLASRATLALLVGVQLAGVVASKSRAGLVGALIVLLPCLPALMRGHRAVRLVAWVMLALVAVPAILIAGPPLLERLSELPREWTSSGGRGAVYRLMAGVAMQLPVFGAGGGAFESMFLLHRPPEITGRYDFAHNDYLQVLVETGWVGLVLLLLPVLAFAVETFRRRKGSPSGDRFDWPLLLSLAAVAGHELVDFGLQLPAPMVFAAVLAGAAARPPARAPRSAPAVVPAGWLALAAALPVVLFGVARWPGMAGPLAVFADPAADHERAREIARESDDPTEALPAGSACRAIELEARAQASRPLSAYFSAGQAAYTLSALRAGAFDTPEVQQRASEQVRRQIDVTRRVDPWNELVRERLMVLSLSIGALDQAMQDARVAGAGSQMRAERVLDELEQAGLPLSLIGPALSSEPQLLQEILRRAVSSEATHGLAAKLVPADVSGSQRLCSIGWRVAATLRAVHDRSAIPFLEDCMEIAKRDPEQIKPDAVRVWMASDHHHFDRLEEIVELLEGRAVSRGRCNLQLSALRRLERWEDLTRAARECLDEGELDRRPRLRARWYAWLGEAYARRDRQTLAIDALEYAVAYDPGSRRYRRQLSALERGENPFD